LCWLALFDRDARQSYKMYRDTESHLKLSRDL